MALRYSCAVISEPYRPPRIPMYSWLRFDLIE